MSYPLFCAEPGAPGQYLDAPRELGGLADVGGGRQREQPLLVRVGYRQVR